MASGRATARNWQAPRPPAVSLTHRTAARWAGQTITATRGDPNPQRCHRAHVDQFRRPHRAHWCTGPICISTRPQGPFLLSRDRPGVALLPLPDSHHVPLYTILRTSPSHASWSACVPGYPLTRPNTQHKRRCATGSARPPTNGGQAVTANNPPSAPSSAHQLSATC